MPSLYCECQEVIVKEGLATYIREYMDGVIAMGCMFGADHNAIYQIMKYCLGSAMRGVMPSVFAVNRELTEGESLVASGTLHMIEESIEAGYSPAAFSQSLQEAVGALK